MRRNLDSVLSLLSMVLLAAIPASAARLDVGLGASLSLGSGTLEAGCSDVFVDGDLAIEQGLAGGVRDLTIGRTGQLDGGGGRIELSGSWLGFGPFLAGASVVRFDEGCGSPDSTIFGSHVFANLELASSGVKALLLEADTTTTVTNALSIPTSASPGLPTRIRSTQSGIAANLSFTGRTQSIGLVDVDDVHASSSPLFAALGSFIGANAPGWIAGGVAAVPTPRPLVTVVFTLLAGLAGLSRLARLRATRRARQGSSS